MSVSRVLEGRVAIVTGAGRGVGRGEALALAAEGARVVVNDMGGDWDGSGADDRPAQEVVDEIVALGGEAVANYDDVADFAAAERIVRQAIDAYGDLDIVVNNAGILRDRMVFSLDESEWDAVIRVHLRGHYCLTRFASAHWREQHKQGSGRHRAIINTTSESGLFGNAGQTNYDAAKLGIVGLTMAAARELQKYDVSVNAIAPRARTRLTTTTFASTDRGDEFTAPDPDEFDVMDPDNIGPVVAFLASDEARDVTGQTFIVVGGSVAHVRMPHVAGFVTGPARWTVDTLAARKDELFADLGPDVFEAPRGFARIPPRAKPESVAQ